MVGKKTGFNASYVKKFADPYVCVVDFGGLADVGQNAQLDVASACGELLNRSLR
jgi:hypothetical protein